MAAGVSSLGNGGIAAGAIIRDLEVIKPWTREKKYG